MAFAPTIRAVMAALAILCTCKLGTAHAADSDLYDWQPCPSSLAIEGGQQPTKKWDLTLSPYTHHWNASTEHRPVKLVALDSHLAGGRFCGLALFTNSFGQESAYVYVGQQWDGILGVPQLFSKVSMGLLYGYRDPYQDKVEFNQLGVAPVIIPSLGYAITPKDSAQIFILGKAGVLFAYARSF